MQYRLLPGTDLKVSVMALGAGGPSRLGQSRGGSVQESAAVVRRAVELGVNFIDTAEAYRTEEIVAEGIAHLPRDQVVLSTKKRMGDGDQFPDASQLRAGLEASLRGLRTDYIDVYHLHGLKPARYDQAVAELVPELLKLREQGKIRYAGVTERFGSDLQHESVRRAVQDGWAQVVMVGFNMLNQTARELVLPLTSAAGVGVMIMFAVRRVFSDSQRLAQVVAELVADGTVDADLALADGDLRFLVHPAGARSVPDAAYRYCLHEPGCDVIISGTGNLEHLRDNTESLQRGPLPAADRERVARLFGRVDDASGG